MPDPLRSWARDARVALGLDLADEDRIIRAHLAFATGEELDAMLRVIEDPRELAQIVRPVLEARDAHRAKRNLAPVTWTPLVTREIVLATIEGRANGRAVVAVSDDLFVEIGFMDDVLPDAEPLDRVEAARREPERRRAEQDETMRANAERFNEAMRRKEAEAEQAETAPATLTSEPTTAEAPASVEPVAIESTVEARAALVATPKAIAEPDADRHAPLSEFAAPGYAWRSQRLRAREGMAGDILRREF